MHALILTALTALIPTADAGSYGGGGMIFGEGYIADTSLTWIGDSAAHAPGDIECFGGVGFGVSQDRVRSGGEGMYCGGEGFGQAYGGFIAGHDIDLGPLYATAYTSMGLGWMAVSNPDYTDPDFARLDHGYVYARPTVALGIPLRWAALELGGYAFGSLSFGQQASGGPLWSFPHLGTQISVLFGGFENRRAWDDSTASIDEDSVYYWDEEDWEARYSTHP